MTMSVSNKGSGGGRTRQRREVTGRTVLVCLVAFFAVVAGVNAVMVSAAVSTFGGIETVNAYQAGLSFANEEAAAQAQEARHWRVSARLRPQPSGSIAVELTAYDQAERPLTGLDAKVVLNHPTARRLDHAVAMQTDGAGHFRGEAVAAAGQWDLIIDLSRDGRRLFRSKERVSLR